MASCPWIKNKKITEEIKFDKDFWLLLVFKKQEKDSKLVETSQTQLILLFFRMQSTCNLLLWKIYQQRFFCLSCDF